MNAFPSHDLHENDPQFMARLDGERHSQEIQANITRSDRLLLQMNHEIRTAVNAILGLTELLRESPLDPKQKAHVNLARTSANRLLQSSAEIIDLRRAELGSLHLCAVTFDLHETLKIAIELLAVLAARKGIRLRVKISESVPRAIISDPERLAQIVITLTRLAIDRMDCGEIWINLDCEPGHPARMIKFSIADTGPGIPSDIVAQVFSSAVPLDGGTESECVRVLTFAKRLVELMGGAMRAEYQLGLGTTVHFDVRVTLPPLSDRAQPNPNQGPVDDLEGRSLKILVAEDAPDNLLLIRAFLGDTLWEVDSAENGRIAVEKAANTRYDLILMDIDMPEIDGHDATRQIRVSECRNELPPVPIIALTAHNEAEAASQSMEAGCSAHLTKPVCKAG